ncbi:AraC family transcriptional regulator [Rhodospirillum rubrum]|uniref:helix-turn-helix transcriptional regulator n=1 Tax=Rhodospirillum rubrum TaxID=1085 RepID=UPI0019050F25|nr:AraC family transcriptional regulator [Rhodospirillum rubrum]MBK1664960.1 AraC family transcriptional regulator [Rhodospirillum rubrum]MBK1676906.1 AraC family transcriptional regulator [Rhodospirillum rubrum]
MYELRSSEFFSDRPSAAGNPPGADVKPVDLQPGMMVSLVSFQGEKEFQATAVNDRSCVHFSCLFRGAVDVAFGCRGFRLETGNLLTSYAPGEKFCLNLPGNYQNVELMVTPDALSALAGSGYDRIGGDIFRGFCVYRNGNNRRACDAAARLARLMEGDRSQRLLIHAAALEFLAWHLDAYQSEDEGGAPLSLRERKLLAVARERLLQDLSNPPTIAELARETGLNQLKLKRGFKALFGHSVYALFQRERMDRARVLLQQNKVTETAMMLGYSNVSHFSAAFRKQFGVLPREARRGALD